MSNIGNIGSDSKKKSAICLDSSLRDPFLFSRQGSSFPLPKDDELPGVRKNVISYSRPVWFDVPDPPELPSNSKHYNTNNTIYSIVFLIFWECPYFLLQRPRFHTSILPRVYGEPEIVNKSRKKSHNVISVR